MSHPFVWPSESGRGRQQSFIVPRMLVDGTILHHAEWFPNMTDDHWAFTVYGFSCTRGETATVFAGPSAARKFCGLTDSALSPGYPAESAWQALYGPLMEYGFARSEGVQFKQGCPVPHYTLMIPPLPTEGGLIKSEHAATRRNMTQLGVPFVTLPQDLIRRLWVELDTRRRRCLSALYAFMHPCGRYIDPHHLHMWRGQNVMSRALLMAAGGDTAAVSTTLLHLQEEGTLRIMSVGLDGVQLYPGSRAPLITDEKNSSGAFHVYAPVLLPPQKRGRRTQP